MYKRLAEVFFWIGLTILAAYYLPKISQLPAYTAMLIAYFRSRDEAKWMTIFFVISDGFWGFFNSYEIVLTLLPGLPPIELGHIYILLSIIKATKEDPPKLLFFDNILKIMAVYVGFLVIQGYLLGLKGDMNVQFRMVKFIFPLALFYSIPRLFRKEEHFRDFFALCFPFAFFALFAQVFTIVTHMTPSQFLGVYREFWFTVDVNKGKTYRGFYSTGMILLTTFGAMYFLARRERFFNFTYLFAVLGANMMSVYLSATRGWVVGLSSGLVLFLLFVLKPDLKKIGRMVGASVILVVGLMAIPIVNKQFTNAFMRLTTLEALASGDATAKGTLSRITERSPRVMNKWSETPLTGWGFSDTFFEYQDFHVGNQNVLLHSGILGAVLMGIFFVTFHGSLFFRNRKLPRGHPWKDALLVFVVFFPGWFFIHSSSGQHFSYYQYPGQAIIVVTYMSLGGLAYRRSYDKTVQEPVESQEEAMEEALTDKK